jgi:tRNA modification GTPase
MKLSKNEDTIVALATPSGPGAIAVIRLSGANSFELTDVIFQGKQKIASSRGYSIHYGKIIDDNLIIDDVLISVFRAPNSYTGENVIEISVHGSPLLVQKIIELLMKHGARVAEPGEFTKRAFLNNKIDLAQAEAVADIINARTNISLRGARNQLDGLLSAKVSEIREKLISTSALLELELDFSEEDIEFVKRDKLLNKIDSILSEIEELISTYKFGKLTRYGINVAIVGCPNVGKSSILNYILKESRAIVSSIPGTTRDTIREEISIDGFYFRLFDTAGIRESVDDLEKEGIMRSKESLKNADIIMFVMDVETGFSNEINQELKNLNPDAKTIKVLNKIDWKNEKLAGIDFFVSAITGAGMKSLIEGLKESALVENLYTEKDVIISSSRHLNCLQNARDNLIKAKKALESRLSPEFIASDIRATEDALMELIGAIVPENILNEIFSKFCIGK